MPAPLLEIHLTSSGGLEAQSISFSHQLLGGSTRRLVRGKCPLTLREATSLPWTAGVKGFIRLCVKTAVRGAHPDSLECDFESHGIVGQRGSLARSLDSAISKKPAWFGDLFGYDASGAANIARFFWRMNPEAKRPGPVGVAINTKMLPPTAIKVFVDSVLVEESQALAEILDALADEPPPNEKVRIFPSKGRFRQEDVLGVGAAPATPTLEVLLASIMRRELHRTLFNTPVFSRSQLVSSLSEITNNSLFRSIAGANASRIESVMQWSSHASRTGISAGGPSLQRFFPPERPLHLSVCVVTVGSIALFAYLRRHRGLSVEINYRYSTGVEIAKTIQSKSLEPDLCVGATPSATQIMSTQGTAKYRPVMLMPKHSHRLLAPANGTDSLENGNFHLLTEQPSGSLFYYQELARRGLVSSDHGRLNHCDADEALGLLKNGSPDMRSILWFPAYDLAEIFCGARTIDAELGHLGDSWIMLLAHERLQRDSLALSTLITELHAAWLDLRENPSLLDQTIGDILQDPEYAKVLTRSHGFHALRDHGSPMLASANG